MTVRVLHVISSLDVGGAEHALETLVTRLDPTRFHNAVACLIPTGEVGRRIASRGFDVRSLGMRRGRPSPPGVWRLARVIRQQSPAVVQSWLYHADLLSAVTTSLNRHLRLVWNVRSSNMDMARYHRLSGWTVAACARLSRFPAVVVFNSEAGRTYHEARGYHPRRTEVIPNGIDSERFRRDPGAGRAVREELGIPGEAPVVGLVARYDPMKDHGTFLAAARRTAAREPAVHFVLAGEGVTAENPAMAGFSTGTLAGRVHLLGSRDDVPRVLGALDVVASSSVSEAFPNSVAEAMACEVPCVVTDVGDAKRVVGDAGIVVPPRDPDSLARGWEELLARGPGMRRELGARARQRIESEFSVARMVASYEGLYSELADESGR